VLRPVALEDLSIFPFNLQTDDLPNPDIFPCKMFYLLCLENPSLCTYVKELIVDASMFVGWDSLLNITSDLCNLRTVTIRAFTSSQAVEDSIPDALIAGLQTALAIPSVSSLQLQECNFRFASIPRFLYQILATRMPRHLDNLHLFSVQCSAEPPPIIAGVGQLNVRRVTVHSYWKLDTTAHNTFTCINNAKLELLAWCTVEDYPDTLLLGIQTIAQCAYSTDCRLRLQAGGPFPYILLDTSPAEELEVVSSQSSGNPWHHRVTSRESVQISSEIRFGFLILTWKTLDRVRWYVTFMIHALDLLKRSSFRIKTISILFPRWCAGFGSFVHLPTDPWTPLLQILNSSNWSHVRIVILHYAHSYCPSFESYMTGIFHSFAQRDALAIRDAHSI
jgi:hypothetical protein